MRKKISGRGGALSVLLSVLLAALVCVALLALAAKLTYSGKLPESSMKPVVAVACALSSLLGALVAVRGQRSRLVSASLFGAALLILLLLAALCLWGEEGPGGFLWTSLLSLLVPALFVGITGGGKKTRRR